MPAPSREMNDAFKRDLKREHEYVQQELELVAKKKCTHVESPNKKKFMIH